MRKIVKDIFFLSLFLPARSLIMENRGKNKERGRETARNEKEQRKIRRRQSCMWVCVCASARREQQQSWVLDMNKARNFAILTARSIRVTAKYGEVVLSPFFLSLSLFHAQRKMRLVADATTTAVASIYIYIYSVVALSFFRPVA